MFRDRFTDDETRTRFRLVVWDCRLCCLDQQMVMQELALHEVSLDGTDPKGMGPYTKNYKDLKINKSVLWSNEYPCEHNVHKWWEVLACMGRSRRHKLTPTASCVDWMGSTNSCVRGETVASDRGIIFISKAAQGTNGDYHPLLMIYIAVPCVFVCSCCRITKFPWWRNFLAEMTCTHNVSPTEGTTPGQK